MRLPVRTVKPWRSRKRFISSRCEASSSMDENEGATLVRRRRRQRDVVDHLQARFGQDGGQLDREGRSPTRLACDRDVAAPSSARRRDSGPVRDPCHRTWRVVVSSAWVKRWNRRDSCSWVMPMPSSRTSKAIQSPSVFPARRADSVIVPFSVNLAALPSRLKRHCRSFTPSVRIVPRSSATSTTSVLALRPTSASTVPAASRRNEGDRSPRR